MEKRVYSLKSIIKGIWSMDLNTGTDAEVKEDLSFQPWYHDLLSLLSYTVQCELSPTTVIINPENAT